MYCAVAFAADGFEVGEVPGVELEVGVGQATLEGADAVVHLCGGREDAFGKTLLAEAAIALKHGFADRTPAAVIIDELVAAVVVVARLLWLRLWPKYARHRAPPFCV